MNYSVIRRTTGLVMKFEAIFLLLPALTGMIYREREGLIYLGLAAAYYLIGYLINFKVETRASFYTKEGFISVGLVWIVISLCGALPFVLCGDIPSYPDALFETISGFTTTGSSILSDVEALSHAGLFWRSFTHWVGGMGVIVFVLAIMPMRKGGTGNQIHMMRAESPGPVVGKLVPKIRDTAKILYIIYFGMTVAEIILLLVAGMPLFDTLCLSFGTAGTGGFGVLGDSIASYPLLQQGIITVFMILFGVNFNAYFFLFLGKDKKDAFRLTEVRWYFLIIAFSVVTITINIHKMFDNLFLAFHHAAYPRAVTSVHMDGKPVENETVRSVIMYLGIYIVIFCSSVLLVTAFDGGESLETVFTAVTATINNIGPGLSAVGPTANFGHLSLASKFVLMFDMLAGRLELYPMLLLLYHMFGRRK